MGAATNDPLHALIFVMVLWFLAPHRLIMRLIAAWFRRSALQRYYNKYEKACFDIQAYFLGEEYVRELQEGGDQ